MTASTLETPELKEKFSSFKITKAFAKFKNSN